jgi:hypothetical protein
MWHLGDYENEFSFVGVDSSDGLSYVAGHMFHRIPNGNVLVYDNASRRQQSSTSRVNEFSLDEEKKIATLVWTYEPDSAVWGWHRGNAQRLENGNTVIGWGGSNGRPSPAFTEVNADGEIVYELSFVPPDIESYRAFRFPFPDGRPSDSVFVTEVGKGQIVEFIEGEEDTGIEIKINTQDPEGGYNEMTVKKYDYAPFYPEFFGKAPMVLPSRMVWSREEIETIQAEVRFEVDKWNIKDPENTIVYHREFEGNGLFLPLETVHNPSARQVRAQADKFGEFILTYPDLESVAYKPWLIAPADSALVNQELNARLEWTPVGYVNSYSLQVATDEAFNTLIVNENILTKAVYDLPVSDNTAYYWRVKSYNDSGDSEWSDIHTFTSTAPFIRLTSPKGGEEWQRGEDYFITWEDIIEDKIALHLNGDIQPITFEIDTVESTGGYRWEVPLDIPLGAYRMRLISLADGEVFSESDSAFHIIDEAIAIGDKEKQPEGFYLYPNYPNPFNPGTTIRYTLGAQNSAPQHVDLSIYNLLGEKIATLVSDRQPAGTYSVKWNAGGFSSGVYFYKLETDQGFSQSRKLLLMK